MIQLVILQYEFGFDRKIKEEINRLKKFNNEVKKNKEVATNRQKNYYDKGKEEKKYKEGEIVLIRNVKKSNWMQELREGPYRIEKVLKDDNYC